MKAPIVEIADAVVDRINARSYEPEFTAVRAYRPKWTLEDLADLRVSVFPISATAEIEDRITQRWTYTVGVNVAKVASTDEDRDSLAELAHDIASDLSFADLAERPAAQWTGTEMPVVADPEQLDEHGVFSSFLTIEYQERHT